MKCVSVVFIGLSFEHRESPLKIIDNGICTTRREARLTFHLPSLKTQYIVDPDQMASSEIS